MTFYNEDTANNIKYGMPEREAPSQNLIPVITSDETIYSPALRGFRVGLTGNVAVLTLADSLAGLTVAKTIPCVAGADNAVYVVKIFSTGTTAGNIVGYRQ